jgi:hypothetical protein
MTGVIDERNRATTERLRVLADRVSDDDLARAIDPPWTASALFAHIAFWDRFVHARWERAAREGGRTPAPVDDLPQDLINEASLPSWLTVPVRIAADGCLATASDVDDLLGRLDADVVEELVATDRARLVDRSIHRSDHLRTLEAAFPAD